VTVPGARVEQHGAGFFQIYQEPPKRDEDPDPQEQPDRPGRPAEITTVSGEVIRGRIVGRTDEGWEVLQAGSVRTIPLDEVKSIRLYPKNVHVLDDGEQPPKPRAPR
jgi:hypothetical protein